MTQPSSQLLASTSSTSTAVGPTTNTLFTSSIVQLTSTTALTLSLSSASQMVTSSTSSLSISESISQFKRASTSVYTRLPEPTCYVSSSIANSTVVQENSLVAVIGDYSAFAVSEIFSFSKIYLDILTYLMLFKKSTI